MPNLNVRRQVAKDMLRLLRHGDAKDVLDGSSLRGALVGAEDELLADLLDEFEGEREGLIVVIPGQERQLCILRARGSDQGGVEVLEVNARTLVQDLARRVAISPHPFVSVHGCSEVWHFEVLENGKYPTLQA